MFGLPTGKPTRQAFGEALVELGRRHPELVVLDGDLSKSTYTRYFAQEFPDRFFNAGIAEANMVGLAAGLASCGKIPVCASFAAFLMCKAFDQMRIGVNYAGLNVKFVGSHGGISIGEDGVSQMAVEDVALAQALPGFVVLVPADEHATRRAVEAAVAHPGPVYIRVGRPKAPLVYDTRPCDFAIGRAILVRDGGDLTIAANGLMVAAALAAAEQLAAEGIEARVLDFASVKPLDRDAVRAAAEETGALVVAEEHLKAGGLGSAIAMALAETVPVPAEFVALQDTYAESGAPEDLMRKYGLTPEAIAIAARRVLERKRAGVVGTAHR
ncbi:transketolase family protein [Thermaerobacter sp. PB12/4term]|uniref:transketolase family protein n=1 Tax=Thermaerobacter sp. PB12/4term TaxID=2293838 RepID=UPI000E328801|nr:transketolase C-terminal domain-containing protein [Thermaerobacter sp. PB12/4term]QIA27752.1 transketolase family protein [Thermaerobacter sp. PB12/4term]